MGEINVHITVINTNLFLSFIFPIFIYLFFKSVKDGAHSFVKLLSQNHKHIFCVVVFILWCP